jgi:hypothetical protein
MSTPFASGRDYASVLSLCCNHRIREGRTSKVIPSRALRSHLFNRISVLIWGTTRASYFSLYVIHLSFRNGSDDLLVTQATYQ